MKSLLVAVQFLTRLPITVAEVSERDLGRSAIAFPIVGAIVGGILYGSYLLLVLLFPPIVARTLTLVVWIAVSGAFHLDGLADTVDGLYGGKDRDDALRIMKDPHVGAMGVIAIVTVLLVKAVSAATLPDPIFRAAILAAPVLGHGMMVLTLALPYARPSGLGRAFADHRSPIDGVVAALLMSGAAFGLLKYSGLAALATALTAAAVVLLMSWRKIRGVTGDVCGAANELAETAFLTALTALPAWGWGWKL